VKVLEIVCLENGDIVLVEAPNDAGGETVTTLPDDVLQEQPLVSIRFSPEVRDMLGDDALGVAEAMIEAATDYLSEATDPQDEHFASNAQLDSGSQPRTQIVDADSDELEDQVSTVPVVLH